MIKLENTEVMGWEHAIRGMRNPMNSWEKSDSVLCMRRSDCHGCDFYTEKFTCSAPKTLKYVIGPNDYDLMMRLARGGPVHAKYRRQIFVSVDITAPIYWWAEMDTYKVGVVRNSCSFMHKGTSKPFEITDFSIKDERVYKILSPLQKRTHTLTYPYDTDEYRIYTDHNGRTYKVFRNGRVLREAFEYVDNFGTGRTRHYDEADATMYQNGCGYFVVKLSGRNGGHVLLHRLVAEVWCDRPEGTTQVNHIDGDKGNNSAENLEWVTAAENMQKAVETGMYDELRGLHHKYRLWKYWVHVIPIERRAEFRMDCMHGMTCSELVEKYDITTKQANQLRYELQISENEDLFQECYVWDKMLETLNYYRSMYLETRDEKIFQAIRILLPQGYFQRSTLSLNYEVLHNIYVSRKNHRLDEWHEFCDWIKSLPYSEIITLEETPDDLS